MLCFLSPPLRHPPGPLLHHPLLFFLPFLISLYVKACCFLRAHSSMGPQLPATAICQHIQQTKHCSPAPFRPAPYLAVSLFSFLFPPLFSGSSITMFIFDLSPPPPLFSTLSRFSLSSSLTCCAFAPRCRPCLFRHLRCPSPQPSYPAASCFTTGCENTGAWYPKQINRKRQRSHSNILTRMDFPADG